MTRTIAHIKAEVTKAKQMAHELIPEWNSFHKLQSQLDKIYKMLIELEAEQ